MKVSEVISVKQCCVPLRVKIIRVGDVRAGIVGFEQMMTAVHASGLSGEMELRAALFEEARRHGNYIAPGMEEVYKDAFLREYIAFCKKQSNI